MNTEPALLSDGTIILRALEPADIDIVMAWENDTRAWTSTTTAAPYSRRTIEDYVMTYDADIFSARQLRMIIETADGTTVGAVDIFDFDPINRRAGIGIVIDPGHRARGYGKRAVKLVAFYCVTRIGMHQLWAITTQDNVASQHIFEAVGFTACGRLRSWVRVGSGYIDAYIYQLLLPAD